MLWVMAYCVLKRLYASRLHKLTSGGSNGSPLFFTFRGFIVALLPTTELEAVNLMLSAIGEAPVSSLTDPSLLDASLAIEVLKQTSMAIQTRGLHCNTDLNYKLTRLPAQSNEINLPTNTAKVDSTGSSAYRDVVQRGTRLYDRENATFTFDEDIYVDIVYLLDFDELPQHVRRYVMTKASRRFQTRFMGSETLAGFTAQDEQEAYIEFERTEAQTEDSNLLTGSYDTYKIIARGAPRRTTR